MRSISEVYPTIIVVSALLALTLTVLPLGYAMLTASMQRSEYEYVKQVFKSIASSFPNIIAVGEYSAVIPSHYTSLGYGRAGVIEVYLNGSSTPALIFNCTALTLGASVSNPEGLVYGSGYYLVNDSRFIPRVYEYRDRSSSLMITELDACRLLVDASVVLTGNLTGYYYILTYYNITVAGFKGTGGSIRVTPTSIRHVYTNINASLWDLKITFIDEVLKSRVTYGVVNLTEVGLVGRCTGVPFSLDIIVVDLLVEVGA